MQTQPLYTPNWQSQHHCPFILAPLHLHLWLANVHHFNTQNLLSYLNPTEVQQANSFTHAATRQQHIASRAILRSLLSQYVQLPASQLPILGGNGIKPSLANNNLKFNVSHANPWLLIGFGHADLGVDIEALTTDVNHKQLLDDYFDAQTRQQILQSDKPVEDFLTLWTQTEAQLKARGLNLEQTQPPFNSPPGTLGQQWSFCPTPGYVASVATVNHADYTVSYYKAESWPVSSSIKNT